MDETSRGRSPRRRPRVGLAGRWVSGARYYKKTTVPGAAGFLLFPTCSPITLLAGFGRDPHHFPTVFHGITFSKTPCFDGGHCGRAIGSSLSGSPGIGFSQLGGAGSGV